MSRGIVEWRRRHHHHHHNHSREEHAQYTLYPRTEHTHIWQTIPQFHTRPILALEEHTRTHQTNKLHPTTEIDQYFKYQFLGSIFWKLKSRTVEFLILHTSETRRFYTFNARLKTKIPLFHTENIILELCDKGSFRGHFLKQRNTFYLS